MEIDTILVQNADDIISVSNTLDKDVWINSKEAIEDNWNRALNFVDYEQNIVDQITNIFEHNGILEV